MLVKTMLALEMTLVPANRLVLAMTLAKATPLLVRVTPLQVRMNPVLPMKLAPGTNPAKRLGLPPPTLP